MNSNYLKPLHGTNLHVFDARTAVDLIHAPDTFAQVEVGRRRYRFEEALVTQVVLGRRRAFLRTLGAQARSGGGGLLAAFDEAKRIGMLTVGITGGDGGRMAELDSIDFLFAVPSASVHRVQEAQTTIYHVLAELSVEGVR